MTLLRRSFFNLIRSPGRSLVVVAILAVSLGLALTMFEVHGATANQLGSISGEIGTNIDVRPAGSFGQVTSGSGSSSISASNNPGTAQLLSQDGIDALSKLAHVVSVQPSLSTNYTGTALTAATPSNLPAGAVVHMMLQVTGLDPSVSDPTLMGGGTMTMVDGRYFTAADAGADVMVVGQSLADANNLKVGDMVDIEGTQVEVIGIYSSGQLFGDNMLIMPISTVQQLYGLDGASDVTVVADNVNNVNTVVDEIRTVFDKNTADVVTAQDQYDAINGSILNAASSSETGMIVSFIVAAAVILLAVFLVMRQRVREIGILKAIGASNWRIGFGFGIETLFVSLVAAVVGTGLTFIMAQKVANMFGSSNSPAGAIGSGPVSISGGGTHAFSNGTTLTSIAGIHVVISPEIFLIAIGVGLALALVASIIPVWYIARVRPAEVLRNE